MTREELEFVLGTIIAAIICLVLIPLLILRLAYERWRR